MTESFLARLQRPRGGDGGPSEPLCVPPCRAAFEHDAEPLHPAVERLPALSQLSRRGLTRRLGAAGPPDLPALRTRTSAAPRGRAGPRSRDRRDRLAATTSKLCSLFRARGRSGHGGACSARSLSGGAGQRRRLVGASQRSSRRGDDFSGLAQRGTLTHAVRRRKVPGKASAMPLESALVRRARGRRARSRRTEALDSPFWRTRRA